MPWQSLTVRRVGPWLFKVYRDEDGDPTANYGYPASSVEVAWVLEAYNNLVGFEPLQLVDDLRYGFERIRTVEVVNDDVNDANYGYGMVASGPTDLAGSKAGKHVFRVRPRGK